MSTNPVTHIFVIGASAAGLRAAARARRCLPSAKVAVIDQDNFISYGACGMPYFVSGEIQTADKLRQTAYGKMRDPDFFRSVKDVEVIIETKVERIDRVAHKVFCRSINTGEESEYCYDKLVLATGASPVMLPGIPITSKRVTTFKTLHDAISLRKSLEKQEISKTAVVGGGFIGCELAESFHALWGVEVILIEAAHNILPNILDPDMASPIESYMRSEGIQLHTDCPLKGITGSDEKVVLNTAKGIFEVDSAIIAVGVTPNSDLARDCGLTTGKGGGIIVDDRMITSDPDIYAAGDCVELKHLISEKPVQLPLGSLANRQGRVVGSNLGGIDDHFKPVVGSAAVKIFDMNIASTGLTESAAKNAGFDVACSWGTFTDKAEYFPESQNVHLKLVYDRKTGRLLGLQGYSKGEVVKRVDVFSALLRHNGYLEDLLDMEFAYAPPYAPPVDPLYSLGSAAKNSMLEGVRAMSPATSLEGRLVIDVRQRDEVKKKSVTEGETQNIPLDELRKRCDEIPRGKSLITVCSKGLRSAEAIRILREKGLDDAAYLGGGLQMKT